MNELWYHLNALLKPACLNIIPRHTSSAVRVIAARHGNLSAVIYTWAATCCPVRYAALLRFCTNYAYRFSLADETVATRPPWLDSSLPRRPCRCVSVYRSIILQTLNSFAIRSQGSTCTLAAAAAYVPYVVAKLLQMMLLNYASLNLRFAYKGM